MNEQLQQIDAMEPIILLIWLCAGLLILEVGDRLAQRWHEKRNDREGEQ